MFPRLGRITEDRGKILFADIAYNEAASPNKAQYWGHVPYNLKGSNHVWQDGHARFVPDEEMSDWTGRMFRFLNIDR